MGAIKDGLTAATEDLITRRSSNINLAASLEEKRVQLERERQKYELTKAKVEKAKLDTKSAEMTAKEAEDELVQREAEYDKCLASLKVLKEKAIKDAQKIADMKQIDVKTRDKEAARQQDLLYNAEIQIQQIERKVARGMGERSDGKRIALKKKTNRKVGNSIGSCKTTNEKRFRLSPESLRTSLLLITNARWLTKRNF